MKRAALRRSHAVWGSVTKGRDPRRFATTALKRAVFVRDNWECHWCGRPITMETGVADHSPIPWNKGGQTIAGNLVAACGNCNRLHGSQVDWRPGPLQA